MKRGVILAALAVCACSPGKPEVPQLALQAIGYFDVTQGKLYGSGCNFVAKDGGMGAVFLAQAARGVIKIDDHLVSLPVASGAPELPQGAHGRYAGALYAATLAAVPGGKHKELGVVTVFDARLTITDARGQTVYDAPGAAQCKPM